MDIIFCFFVWIFVFDCGWNCEKILILYFLGLGFMVMVKVIILYKIYGDYDM